MGTLLNIEIECASDSLCNPMFAAAGQVAQDIESRMTTYRPSEVTRLKDKAGLADFMQPVSRDTYTVISGALRIAQASDGLFDPTLGSHGSYRDINITAANVGLRRPGMLIDLGGIAKGYALDQIGAAFTGHSFTLNFGGQIMTHGIARHVTLYDPRDDKSALLACNFSEGSLSTSAQNQRPGHLINPKTHLPGAQNIAAVVWHPVAMEADAWSTALFLAGAAEFDRLTQKYQLAAWQLTAANQLNISQGARKLNICTTPSGQ